MEGWVRTIEVLNHEYLLRYKNKNPCSGSTIPIITEINQEVFQQYLAQRNLRKHLIDSGKVCRIFMWRCLYNNICYIFYTEICHATHRHIKVLQTFSESIECSLEFLWAKYCWNTSWFISVKIGMVDPQHGFLFLY